MNFKNLKLSILGVCISIVLLSGCNTSTDPDYDQDYNAIKTLGIKEAIAIANDWKDSKPDITSFITSKELKVVFPDEREVTIAIPDDEMYIAVAPYIRETHECSTHYLSSCQGEMDIKEFSLTIKNEQGQMVFDGSVTSLKNGFFEIWLPRDERFNCNIEYDDMSAEFILETFEDSNTCVTTVNL
jgi:hypothetical protein